METYVYADVLFLLNFCMDFLVLFLTGRVFRKKVRLWRVIAGAAIAALVYCVFFCLNPTMQNGALTMFFGVMGILGGTAVCFLPLSVKEYLVVCAGALVLTIAIGGGCLAVYYMLVPGGWLSVVRLPWQLLAFASAAAYITIRLVMSRLRRMVMEKAALCSVTLRLFDKEAVMEGLVDTGHGLREPISGKPVVIAEFAAVKAILPDNVKALFAEGAERDMDRVAEDFTTGGLASRLRLIPYRSVGERSGVLVGFRPDGLLVGGAEREAVVAVYNGELSGTGEFQALLSAELYNKEVK